MVKIPEWWIETTLVEVAEIIMWQSPKGESYNINWDWMPFYQWVTEFSDKFVWLKTYTTEPTKIIKPWTILFSVRAPVWRVNFTKREACIWRWNAGLNMNNGNQEYLFYLLKHIESQILRSSSWTVFDSISWKELQKISIIIPENPNEQKAIASVLSSFDDKIELLRAENQTLEEMWQTLFKERFISPLAPWRGNWTEKNSSDSKKEKSPSGDLGAELPDGWKWGKLGDSCETFLWWTPSRDKKEYRWWNIPWINSWKVNENRIISPSEYITEEWLNNSATKILPKWTILLAITWATLWQYSLLCIDSCFNQSVVWIKENELLRNEYLFYYIGFTIKELINAQTWWAQQHINKQVVDKHDIIIPTKDILQKYYWIVAPLFTKIENNLFEIQTLSTTRDQLLPKLMSWEVRVKF